MSASPQPQPNADVRMRGFATRATVEAAVAWIDSVLPPFAELPAEEVSLFEAAGRILARDVTSQVNVPAFARSMMDGFALRGEETHGATAYNSLSLRIVGTCLPGAGFPGTVAAGQAVRIMTGAPLPAGADAVLPVEQSELDGDMLRVLDQVSVGKHVGQIGEDIRCGDVVREAGRTLRPQDLGVFSSIGVATVPVIRRPRVRILVTGNELLPAGTPPEGFRIADANGPMLAALVARDGGVPEVPGLIRDDSQAILAALLEPADVVLVSGGSSVGQEDHVPKLLAEQGELAIHGVAMRPSSPTGMGRLALSSGEFDKAKTSEVSEDFGSLAPGAASQSKISGPLVFLLPGNPVSCLCAYDFFAGRAIRALGGRVKDWPYRRIRAVLTRKLVSTVGRVDYARVLVRGNGVEPLAISGAAVLSSTTRADGFVIIPADSEGYPAGAEVVVMLYLGEPGV